MNGDVHDGQLEAGYIIQTLDHLCRRIEERFPDRGLARIAEHLLAVGREANRAARRIRKGWPALRLGMGAVILVGLLSMAFGIHALRQERPLRLDIQSVPELVALVETSVGLVVFVGAAAIFLLTLEARARRSRALRKVHELRCIAHVIDMHQLHKDPDRLTRGDRNTKSSPALGMTAFELGRYLDYCSELLALTSKIGALYVQRYEDPVAVNAVDQLESLTTGLSRKIWQKIMILDRGSVGAAP